MGGSSDFRSDIYRGRSDTNSVATAATWIASENTGWTQDVSAKFRMRFRICNAGTNGNSAFTKIQYNKNSAGWNDVTTSSSVLRAVDVSSDANDQTITSAQLTTAAGSFGTGRYSEDGTASSSGSISNSNGYAEFEFGLQLVSADVANADTVQVRVINASGDTITADVSATITVQKTGYTIALAAGSFAVSPAAVSLERGRMVGAGAASVSVSGTAVSLERGREVEAGEASIAMSSSAVGLERGRLVAASPASFDMGGQAVALECGREITVATASFALTGAAVALVYELLGYLLPVETTTFSMSGAAAAILRGRGIAVDVAAYGFGGVPVSVLYGREIEVGSAGFGFSGSNVTFQKHSGETDPLERIIPRMPGSRFNDRRFNEGGFRPVRK